MVVNAQRIVMPLLRQVVARPRLAEVLFKRDRWGNPLSDERYSNPFPLMERIREDGTLVYRQAYQAWFVTGYDEIQTLVSHPDVSAAGQIELIMDVRPYNKLKPTTRVFFRNWMLILDEPDHARIRRLVSRAFTPKRIAEMEPLIEQVANDLLEPLAGRGRVDIATEFNSQLPARAIAKMLGIPQEREQWLLDKVADVALFLSPFDIWDPERVDRAVAEIDEYFGELADERRREPRDDLLTALVDAEEDGGRLSREELVANVGLLAFAGFDTTASALGNFMLALFQNPDQRQLLMDNSDLWPNAIEELLRYDGPTALNQRFTTAPIDIGGQVIPADSALSLMLQAGNRDPRKWNNPDQLLLDRPDPRPLSFGHGIHYCLGAHLARLELRIGLQAFLKHFGHYTVDESSIEWRRSLAIKGPLSLIVTAGP